MGKYYVTAASLHKNCILLKSRLLNCSIQRKKTCFFPFFFPKWGGILKWNMERRSTVKEVFRVSVEPGVELTCNLGKCGSHLALV